MSTVAALDSPRLPNADDLSRRFTLRTRRRDPTRTRSWIDRSVAGLVVVVVACPFWAGRFLPFLDLPQHLALSSVIARYGDPVTQFSTYYRIDWHITPYWGFYAAMHALIVSGVDAVTSARLLYTSYAIGLPLAVAFLLTTLRRDWRAAVFTLPLVYNTNLFWGFAGFTLSLPLFTYALALVARTVAARDPRRDDRWRLAAAAVLVCLFHAQSYALLGVATSVLVAIEWQGVRWALHRAAPFALSLLLFLPWCWRTFASSHIAIPDRVSTAVAPGDVPFDPVAETSREPIGAALAEVPDRLVGVYNDGSDYAIGASMVLVFVAACAIGVRRRPRLSRAALVEHRGECVCLVLFATYLVTPIKLAAQWYVSPRNLMFAALLAPSFLPRRGPLRRVFLAAGCIVALWASADAAEKIHAFQNEIGGFATVVDRMEPGRRAVGLIFDTGASGAVRYWPFLHWSCYYQLEKGGDVAGSFAGFPPGSPAAHAIPVSYRSGRKPPRPDEWKPQQFRWATMGWAYDYFVIRGRPQGDAARLAEHADLLVQDGAWQLWRRRPSVLAPR